MKRPTMVELRKMIEKDFDHTLNMASMMDGDDNPQVVKMRQELIARSVALLDVLDAISGNACNGLTLNR
jgi:hypothetical protein